MNNHFHYGFSLFELCWALVIIIILFLIALPAFQEFIEATRTRTTVNQLVNLLNYAKLRAIHYHVPVTICASKDEVHCNAEWKGNFIIFIDKNANGKLEAKDNLLRIWQITNRKGSIRWQAKQSFLTMQPTGINAGNAGKFYYCPTNKNLEHARVIVINLVGRIRVTDRKGDPDIHCH